MEKFVPSYQNEEERLEIRKEKDRQDRRKTMLISTIVAIVIFVIVFVSYTLANKKYSVYKKYEQKMEIYGFAKLYNDHDARTKDLVTKSEAIKLILACVYNTPDISGLTISTEETYPNSLWVEYAISRGIVTSDELNEKTANDKVKYKDITVWFYNIKTKILDQTPDTEAKVDVKDIKAYNPDQQMAINDLINSNVLVENTKYINGNKKLNKGKLNELIINFSEEYNTITVADTKLNINEEKIPSNFEMYPYTLASVQKDIYELPFKNEGQPGFISPVDYFADNKQYYNQIKDYVENYYSTMTNIDYTTIDTNQIVRKIKKNVLEEVDVEELEKYVKYVKDNHIKISSKVTGQFPCVYFDGQDYRVRVKIELTIDSADTQKNLLYLDKNTTYSDKMYTLYIDTKMQKNGVSNTLFIKEGAIHSLLAKKSNGIVSVGD